ncbi:phosphotransferase family protein [Sphingobium rhizovicinum]|uniref:Phosphotransferase family protein n=1 Tax=Sphingobium rhizovicinum TaxID=432308 RepID=A0ABV7NLU0_9SPHN
MSLPHPSHFLAAGQSAEVFRLEQGLVLKLFHDGVEAGIVEREYALMQTVQATGLPVAHAVEQREVGGRRGIVYVEMDGPDLLAYLRRHPWRWRWALDQMAQLQWEIQAQRLPLLRSRKALLAEDIEGATLSDRVRAAAVERLDQLVEGDSLSHGDLHPANLIVTSQGLAVIDWSRAARAAPPADVVRSEMLMRFGPGQAGGWWEERVRDAATRHYVDRYCTLADMAPEALAAWRPLVALAWMRHRGPARDEAFAAYVEAALTTAGLPSLAD